MKIETISVHAGNKADEATGAVTPPLHLSSTFVRDADGEYSKGFKYIRHGNPNRNSLEECLSALEGGAAAAAFASGSAASMSVFQALQPGDHVIVPDDMYHGTALQLRTLLSTWGLQVSFTDMTDAVKVKSLIQKKTKLIWIETPSNPLLRITDMKKISGIAHDAGAVCVCDNTFCTPVLQQPFLSGADLVVHSATKYLGGHSDVLGGVAVSRKEDAFFRKIREVQLHGGAVASPFDCFLTLRGIRTLPWRMRAHSENAAMIAKFLSASKSVEKVFYPGLKNHTGHEIASAQMSLYGGMISFLVKGGKEKAMEAVSRTKIFTRATSLGGVESLIEHRASMEGANTLTPQNLVRLSIGLENAEDLMEDLEQAMGK